MSIDIANIKKRILRDFLGAKLIDNALRGYWCEAMIAEALGPECTIVSGGWHAWDLQIGGDSAGFPERVRIQVKNSARLQTWQVRREARTDPQFTLTWRRKPFYFERDRPDIHCE